MSARLEVEGVTIAYRPRGRMLGIGAADFVAVEDVSLSLDRGEALGVVGESGSGKSSLARAIAGIVPPSQGRILLDGEELGIPRSRRQRLAIQMVFQDPSSALNPRMTVGAVLLQLLAYHDLAKGQAAKQRVAELLELVGLPERVAAARPGQLSGGQRQRASIARALAVEPEVLIADEATSALDVSVQATILRLLDRLRRELSLALLFISHDLAVVRSACSRVAVMNRGRIVEEGESDLVLTEPREAYTQALLDAVPELRLPAGGAG